MPVSMAQGKVAATIDAVDVQRQQHRQAVTDLCEQLRSTLDVPAYRIWYCPFSGDELIELATSGHAGLGTRSMVFFASNEEQLRYEPMSQLTLLQRDEEGNHPRWDNVIRDLGVSGLPRAPMWEADLCRGRESAEPGHGSESLERIGVITLFDPTGHASVPEELSGSLRKETNALLQQLSEAVDAYRQACYDVEVLGALERRFTDEIMRSDAPLDATSVFEGIAAWMRRIPHPEGTGEDASPSIASNVCALFIKDENRLVQVDATFDYKVASSIAVDGQLDNPLTSVPLGRNDGSLLAFAHEVMSKEHQPLIFPSGRGDGAYVMSLVEDLRARIARLTIEGEDEDEGEDVDEDGAPSPRLARSMLGDFFQRLKHRGSIGFFPLMRREEVEGMLVLLSGTRTFFNAANVLLMRAVAHRLCRVPDLLPDHRQDKDYRDRKTRLIYVEQRHQRLDRYLTGGLRVQGVAFLDLDGFREVNDVYGHKVGDRVLESVMEGLAVAAWRPAALGNRYSALQFVEQEKHKIDAEQYAATELSKTRRRRRLRLLPLHYGGDEFGLVFLGKDEGEEGDLIEVCSGVVEDLLGYLRFRMAGQVDASRLRLSAGLALPSRLEAAVREDAKNEFALYTALRDLGDTLMYYAKGTEGVSLYCPGHTVVEHRFELELDEGGPGVWRATLVSNRETGDRVPMSGDVLQLDLMHSLDRSVGRHIRNGEEREAVLRRIKKSMPPVRFEVLHRLPQASPRGGRGSRDEYLVRRVDRDDAVKVSVGDQIYGLVRL